MTKTSSSNLKHLTQSAHFLRISATPKNDFIIARHNTLKKGSLELESLLINEILKGPSHSQRFDCGHRNYYQLARASVIHELVHIYDLKNLRPFEDINHIECKKTRPPHQKGSSKEMGPRCILEQKNSQRKTTISELISFKKLSNWNLSLFGNSAKNTFSKRSPDYYEYKNLKEHFAVNMEFFLLDPNYACRRPSYYDYFKNKFSHTPFPQVDCRVFTKVELDDKELIADLDPQRIYRIDYLLASKGESLISGFGHSMFRVVLCAPFRQEVSSKCLDDKLHHVVLSYRANVTDVKSNVLKGLTGGYDSILFMLSFSDVLKEYNTGELRDLYSIPLELNQTQKESFIHRSLETYWQYRGQYKFVTENCATESLELLQASLPEHKITVDGSLTPYGLVDAFIENGLVKEENFSSSKVAREQGMFYPSDKEMLNKVKTGFFGDEEKDYKQLNWANQRREFRHIPKPKKRKSVRDILIQIPYERLENLYHDLLGSEGLKWKDLEIQKKLDQLSILTQSLIEIHKKNLDEEIGNFLEAHEEKDSELGEMIREWNESKKNKRYTPLDGSYGIPLFVAQEGSQKFRGSKSGETEIRQELLHEIEMLFQEDIDSIIEFSKLVERTRKTATLINLRVHL